MKIVEQYPEIPEFPILASNSLFYTAANNSSIPDFKESLYFDIETTGLSSKRSHIYLMGAMWIENNRFVLRQWFAERPSDEELILQEFLQVASGFLHLIHFNGSTFDIPYICNKALYYGLNPLHIRSMTSIDQYQLYRPFKTLLCTKDMKLSTLQKLCGYTRMDQHSGKELINVYEQYLMTGDSDSFSTLIQHNMDDIAGMPSIWKLDTVKALYNGNLAIKQMHAAIHPVCAADATEGVESSFVNNSISENISAYLDITCEFSRELHYMKQLFCFAGFSMRFEESSCYLRCPVISDTFYYYFPDYKNYYYLPNEDKAVHKSIGAYVEASARKKATADTCYEKKNGCFLRLFSPIMQPALQTHPKAANVYYVPFQTEHVTDTSLLSAYFTHILTYLLQTVS